MHQRPLSGLGSLGQVDPRLLEDVVGKQPAGVLKVRLDGLHLQFRAVLEQLLQHLLGHRRARRLPTLLLLHAKLGEKLGKLRLEVAPVLDLLGGVVFLLVIGA